MHFFFCFFQILQCQSTKFELAEQPNRVYLIIKASHTYCVQSNTKCPRNYFEVLYLGILGFWAILFIGFIVKRKSYKYAFV